MVASEKALGVFSEKYNFDGGAYLRGNLIINLKNQRKFVCGFGQWF